jgi:hypothetical protein
MAAHRKAGPLFHTEGLFRVRDGTECRMPSPTPGPLRDDWNVRAIGTVLGDSFTAPDVWLDTQTEFDRPGK